MGRIVGFVKNWMLPIAIVFGISLCLAFHFIPFLKGAEEDFQHIASQVQPVFVSIMLFLQLNVVAPTDLKPKKWFFSLLGLQCGLFVVLSLLASWLEPGILRLLAECTMLCVIAPTAAAAGVITGKIGGSISNTMSYTVIINFMAALLIPLMVPIVNPASDVGFLSSFWSILKRVFSILVLPCLAAWFIRYVFPKVHDWLSNYVGWAFYTWAVTLTLAMAISTSALLKSGIGIWETLLIALVSLLCCLVQFWLGHHVSRCATDNITAGQALGQKNTGFVIWLGYTFLTPVTSIAGGMYAIWQNLVNSYELYEVRKSKS